MPPTTLPIQIPQTLPIAAPAPAPAPITITSATPDVQAAAMPITPIEIAPLRRENSGAFNLTEHQTLQEQQQQQQLTAVTPMSENGEELKEIEAAITVHQIQSPTVEQPIRTLERNLSDTNENEEVATRRYRKAKPAFEPFKTGPNIMERRVTGFQKPDEDTWQQVENEGRDKVEDEKSRPYNVWAKNRNDLYFEDEFGKMELKSKTVQFQVEERIDQVDSETEKDLAILKERRPTGYVRNPKDIEFAEDDHRIKDQELWREMEKDIDADFSVNIEEEFNKIRHSYEANEEGFLESPTGYGKNIDEDWQNFENLENAQISNKEKDVVLPTIKARKPKSHIKEWKTQTHLENQIYKEQQQREVTFNVEDDNDDDIKEENKSTFVKPRRATGFVRDKVAFDEQLWAEDETSSNNTNEDEPNNQYEEPISILSERRPTGYVRDTETLDFSDDEDARESIIEFEHEPLKKLKPRQKVTFQFQTESHSPPQTPSDIVESDADVEQERLSQEMPKPMQRMTKMRYTATNNETVDPTPPPRVPPPYTAALLFSTQVSAEYSSATENEFGGSVDAGGGNDSWSAIRKHRNLTEEFQQIPLEGETTDTVLPRRPAPKAAYRNPLAQMAVTTTTTTVDAEDAEEYVKPRTMRDMKKAQSRRAESLLFETHAGTADA